MKHSLKSGLGFGITSGIITTLGSMVGLHSGTHSMLAVLGGVLTIAIADAFSDSLGIHVSKEFENKGSQKEVWEATITTFISKFIIATTFIIPLLLFSLSTAIKIGIAWGLSLLGIFSFFIARDRKVRAWPVILEHLAIATIVILITQFAGTWIRSSFI